LLQTILNKAKNQGFLNLSIPVYSNADFPMIRYADDTLIILEGCSIVDTFLSWKPCSTPFADSSGSKVNYSKSVMLPINVEAAKFDILAKNFCLLQRHYTFHIFGTSFGNYKAKN